MTTLLMLSQKGGSGKTTLAVHLAVAAGEVGREVTLADTDPQGTAFAWGVGRGFDIPPQVVKASARTAEQMSLADGEAKRLLIVDSPGHTQPEASRLARAATLILIPCRPTAFDIGAVEVTVNIVRQASTPALFVLNACSPRAPEIEEARTLLHNFGFAVFPGQITERQSFARAVASGRAVTEFERHGKAAEEIRALWAYLTKELTNDE